MLFVWPCSGAVTSNVSWLPSSFPFWIWTVTPGARSIVPVTWSPESFNSIVEVILLPSLANVAVQRPLGSLAWANVTIARPKINKATPEIFNILCIFPPMAFLDSELSPIPLEIPALNQNHRQPNQTEHNCESDAEPRPWERPMQEKRMLVQHVFSTHRVENVEIIQGPYCLYKDKKRSNRTRRNRQGGEPSIS